MIVRREKTRRELHRSLFDTFYKRDEMLTDTNTSADDIQYATTTENSMRFVNFSEHYQTEKAVEEHHGITLDGGEGDNLSLLDKIKLFSRHSAVQDVSRRVQDRKLLDRNVFANIFDVDSDIESCDVNVTSDDEGICGEVHGDKDFNNKADVLCGSFTSDHTSSDGVLTSEHLSSDGVPSTVVDSCADEYKNQCYIDNDLESSLPPLLPLFVPDQDASIDTNCLSEPPELSKIHQDTEMLEPPELIKIGIEPESELDTQKDEPELSPVFDGEFSSVKLRIIDAGTPPPELTFASSIDEISSCDIRTSPPLLVKVESRIKRESPEPLLLGSFANSIKLKLSNFRRRSLSCSPPSEFLRMKQELNVDHNIAATTVDRENVFDSVFSSDTPKKNHRQRHKTLRVNSNVDRRKSSRLRLNNNFVSDTECGAFTAVAPSSSVTTNTSVTSDTAVTKNTAVAVNTNTSVTPSTALTVSTLLTTATAVALDTTGTASSSEISNTVVTTDTLISTDTVGETALELSSKIVASTRAANTTSMANTTSTVNTTSTATTTSTAVISSLVRTETTGIITPLLNSPIIANLSKVSVDSSEVSESVCDTPADGLDSITSMVLENASLVEVDDQPAVEIKRPAVKRGRPRKTPILTDTITKSSPVNNKSDIRDERPAVRRRSRRGRPSSSDEQKLTDVVVDQVPSNVDEKLETLQQITAVVDEKHEISQLSTPVVDEKSETLQHNTPLDCESINTHVHQTVEKQTVIFDDSFPQKETATLNNMQPSPLSSFEEALPITSAKSPGRRRRSKVEKRSPNSKIKSSTDKQSEVNIYTLLEDAPKNAVQLSTKPVQEKTDSNEIPKRRRSKRCRPFSVYHIDRIDITQCETSDPKPPVTVEIDITSKETSKPGTDISLETFLEDRCPILERLHPDNIDQLLQSDEPLASTDQKPAANQKQTNIDNQAVVDDLSDGTHLTDGSPLPEQAQPIEKKEVSHPIETLPILNDEKPPMKRERVKKDRLTVVLQSHISPDSLGKADPPRNKTDNIVLDEAPHVARDECPKFYETVAVHEEINPKLTSNRSPSSERISDSSERTPSIKRRLSSRLNSVSPDEVTISKIIESVDFPVFEEVTPPKKKRRLSNSPVFHSPVKSKSDFARITRSRVFCS